MKVMENVLNTDKLEHFAVQVKKHKIDHCQVFHQDRVVFSHARNSVTERRLHKFNSVTKSVLSLLIGISIDRRELDGVDSPLSLWFPDAPMDVTVGHLLTMTPGWSWPEWGDWGGRPQPMQNSKNWIRFIMSRERLEPPGMRMRYDSGSSQLLSAILQKATGMTADKYAERHLFGPLGIDAYRWYSDPKGTTIGGFGLEFAAQHLLTIGRLMLDQGVWNGRRIVSEDWVASSTERRFHTYDKVGSYGYHWWVLTQENDQVTDPYVFFAMGYGGQYIFVVPDLRIVVTFASTLYKDTFLPLRLFRQLMF
ncbi:serine hydrolase [Cohnella pontilimi]|uniref:Serine hydrolase n=1 Tax=Cohnella pontilimi TaxID=2564100 RepID=A0A4U0FIA8_9BACL|nr:serine hydrolase [Cohnella pontilimi]TJY44184.1 serine hydrolase [Cohnella pontilimi]